jgi:hypothetical protein
MPQYLVNQSNPQIKIIYMAIVLSTHPGMTKIAPKLFQSTHKNEEEVVFGHILQVFDRAYTGLS